MKDNAISQEEYDDAVQANLEAKAAVVAAKAQVEQADLNLGFRAWCLSGAWNLVFGSSLGLDYFRLLEWDQELEARTSPKPPTHAEAGPLGDEAKHNTPRLGCQILDKGSSGTNRPEPDSNTAQRNVTSP